MSNDPRGSGSNDTRKDELKDLGDVHHGRKRAQPARDEVRRFYRDAQPLLDHETIWFDEAMRRTLAEGVAEALAEFGYTLFAFAVCRNHAHGVARTHRDHSDVIWRHLTDASRDALRTAGLVPANHPVWSHRPYKVFKYTHADVRSAIDYVNDNPVKEGLPRQHWDFIVPFRA